MIVHSIEVKTKAFASLYEIYGQKVVKKVVEHHKLNGGMSRTEKFKFYHKNFLNKILNEKEINFLEKTFSKNVVQQVIKAKYLNGVVKYIKYLNKRKMLFISTGTPEDEIKIILKEKKIYNYFNGVYGTPNSKVYHINHILNKFKLDSDELIFFGDSSIDFEAANETKVDFVLIENKYNSFLSNIHKGVKILDFRNLL